MTREEAIRYAQGMLADGGNQRKQDFVKLVCEALERWNLYEQFRWERDVALEQLKEIGCTFGQKMDDVKEAVDKQTAKKPRYITSSFPHYIKENDPIEYGYDTCPCCDKMVFEPKAYCDNCGQAIDWSE